MPTTNYNFDVMTSTLRTVLTQHSIRNVEEIVEDCKRQLTQAWDAQGINPEQYNQLFQQGQAKGAGGQQQQQNR